MESPMYFLSRMREASGDKKNHAVIAGKMNVVFSRMKRLNAAAGRLLFKMHSALEKNGFDGISRHQIAALIGREKLNPHDIRCLGDLMAAGFIEQNKVTRWHENDTTPHGYEYRYTMDIDTAWLVRQVRNRQKKNSRNKL